MAYFLQVWEMVKYFSSEVRNSRYFFLLLFSTCYSALGIGKRKWPTRTCNFLVEKWFKVQVNATYAAVAMLMFAGLKSSKFTSLGSWVCLHFEEWTLPLSCKQQECLTQNPIWFLQWPPTGPHSLAAQLLASYFLPLVPPSNAASTNPSCTPKEWLIRLLYVSKAFGSQYLWYLRGVAV